MTRTVPYARYIELTLLVLVVYSKLYVQCKLVAMQQSVLQHSCQLLATIQHAYDQNDHVHCVVVSQLLYAAASAIYIM
jgi:hypothetical protein